MSLFDGLEALGLSSLKNSQLYEKAKVKNKYETEKEAVEEKPVDEKDFLFEKQFECPVCDAKFRQWVVRSNKARLVGQDKDLRPHHNYIDVTKYDVVFCNRCGYAALTRYYGPLAKPHRDLLKENIASKYQPMKDAEPVLSYEISLVRYKLALLNAVCRQAKNSEKAYICLKTAWILRGMQENLPEDSKERSDYKTKEMEYLQNALDGFISARESETPPLAGMNSTTLDYLLAVLCIQFDRLDEASKLVQGILQSTSSTSMQKEKARTLFAEIKGKKKAKG